MNSFAPPPLTRRAFLTHIARVGGAAAAMNALDALGGMPLAIGESHRYGGPPPLMAGLGVVEP